MTYLLELLMQEKYLANAIAAIAGTFTALAAVIVSVWALWIQRRHNVLSVRPIPEITVADYENSLRVKLRNNGSGPMFVISVQVFNDREGKDSVVDWMPDLPDDRMWTNFSMVLKNRTLQPDGTIPLLELTENETDTNFQKCRDMTRNALSKLKVVVRYTDIYGSNTPLYEKSLDWFVRHKSDT